jgi:hypothetical protein
MSVRVVLPLCAYKRRIYHFTISHLRLLIAVFLQREITRRKTYRVMPDCIIVWLVYFSVPLIWFKYSGVSILSLAISFVALVVLFPSKCYEECAKSEVFWPGVVTTNNKIIPALWSSCFWGALLAIGIVFFLASGQVIIVNSCGSGQGETRSHKNDDTGGCCRWILSVLVATVLFCSVFPVWNSISTIKQHGFFGGVEQLIQGLDIDVTFPQGYDVPPFAPPPTTTREPTSDSRNKNPNINKRSRAPPPSYPPSPGSTTGSQSAPARRSDSLAPAASSTQEED